MLLFASYDSNLLGNVSKNLKSNEAYRVFASKCLNTVFQFANCLILDAYFGGKVRFIRSEIFLVKVKILKKRFRHSVVFSGQALTIYHN